MEYVICLYGLHDKFCMEYMVSFVWSTWCVLYGVHGKFVMKYVVSV